MSLLLCSNDVDTSFWFKNGQGETFVSVLFILFIGVRVRLNGDLEIIFQNISKSDFFSSNSKKCHNV